MRLQTVEVPPAFNRIAAGQTQGAVLEVPIADDPAQYPRRMLYQTAHRRPIYGGYVARGRPPLALDAVPGFSQLKSGRDEIVDVIEYDQSTLPTISRAVLSAYGADFVVIEKTLLSAGAAEHARELTARILGVPPVEQDAFTITFKTPAASAAPRLPAMWLDTGWSYLESAVGPRDGGVLRWRWMAGEARLGLVSPSARSIRLRWTGRAFARSRRLALSLNGVDLATVVVSSERGDYRTPWFDVPAGVSFIEVRSLDGTDTPGVDPRRLSVAWYRAAVEEP
jgi:hypothetical protein